MEKTEKQITEDITYDRIKELASAADTFSLWSWIVVITFAVTLLSGKTSIGFLGITLERYSLIIAYHIVYLLINLNFIRLLILLLHLYKSLAEGETKTKVTKFLTTHISPFNPFLETGTYLDYANCIIMPLLWAFGSATSMIVSLSDVNLSISMLMLYLLGNLLFVPITFGLVAFMPRIISDKKRANRKLAVLIASGLLGGSVSVALIFHAITE